MITVLLEQIIRLLKGWIESFNNHAEAVEESLTDLNNTASDIELNTDPIPEIRDNTGAIITPITQIKTNTDSIKTDVTQIKTDTGIIKNNANSIATSAGAAAAFAEDCATNTLDIKDKITTIASDTTQLRADSANIAADVSSINQALGYYIANTPVTEDVEGDLCNLDTDLEDYLQKAICTIPADGSGFSSIDINKVGKNLIDDSLRYISGSNYVYVGATSTNYEIYLAAGNYTVSADMNGQSYGFYYRKSISGSNISIWPAGSFLTSKTITVSETGLYRFWFYSANGVDTNNISNVLLEMGNTATTYEPYKKIVNTVSFGSTITDGAEIDLLSGIVKINTSPVTYSSITPIAIRTYKGVNNIYSDVGSMSLTYRETLKHYLDKQQ